MTIRKTRPKGGSQVNRFRETARALGCDEDENRFNAALRTLVKNPNNKKALDTIAEELGQNETNLRDKPR